MINMYTKCHRDSCFAHCSNNGEYPNNCEILNEVYEDNQKCPFYKRTIEEINKTRVKEGK